MDSILLLFCCHIFPRALYITKVTLKSENNFREKRLWVQIFPSRCDFWCTTGHTVMRKSSHPQLQTFLVNNKECETQDQIREGWAGHFQRLASPLENTRFEKEYKQMMDLDMEAIEILCREGEFAHGPSNGSRGRLSTEAKEQQSRGHNGPYKRASKACRY